MRDLNLAVLIKAESAMKNLLKLTIRSLPG